MTNTLMQHNVISKCISKTHHSTKNQSNITNSPILPSVCIYLQLGHLCSESRCKWCKHLLHHWLQCLWRTVLVEHLVHRWSLLYQHRHILINIVFILLRIIPLDLLMGVEVGGGGGPGWEKVDAEQIVTLALTWNDCKCTVKRSSMIATSFACTSCWWFI
jgi:hypothetical protein